MGVREKFAGCFQACPRGIASYLNEKSRLCPVRYRHVRLQDIKLPVVEYSSFNFRNLPTSQMRQAAPDGDRYENLVIRNGTAGKYLAIRTRNGFAQNQHGGCSASQAPDGRRAASVR